MKWGCSMPTTPVITARHLSKTYYTFRKPEGLRGALRSLFYRERVAREAVKGISFTVAPGELVGFLGPNGAGKTTTLKMLTGILHPTAGEAYVLGHIPWKREKSLLKQIALVMGQKSQLWWDLPAADTFLLNKDIYELSTSDYRCRLKELTELFELEDLLHIPVRQLSLGERMKCELAACLLHSPTVLFLDEPTIGLDLVSQRKLRHFLKEYNARHQLTIVLTSHYMQDVKELCRRVVVINHGVIIYDGSISDLLAQHAGTRLIKLTWAEPLPDQQVQEDMRRSLMTLAENSERRFRIAEFDAWSTVLEVSGGATAAGRTAAQITAVIPVSDVQIQEPDIEKVMAELFSTAPASGTDGAGDERAGSRL